MAITKRIRSFAVADEIDAAGQNPTLAAVRKAVGGGSFTTISDGMTRVEGIARPVQGDAAARTRSRPAVAERLVELRHRDLQRAAHGTGQRPPGIGEREALEVRQRLLLEADKAEAAELADQVTGELEVVKAAPVGGHGGRAGCTPGVRQPGRQALAEQTLRAATQEARAQEIDKRVNDLNAELARVNQQNAEGSSRAWQAAAKPATPPPAAGPGRVK